MADAAASGTEAKPLTSRSLKASSQDWLRPPCLPRAPLRCRCPLGRTVGPGGPSSPRPLAVPGAPPSVLGLPTLCPVPRPVLGALPRARPCLGIPFCARCAPVRAPCAPAGLSEVTSTTS
ncbi:uncharacterized protein LOC119528525 isoform X2 [Choloepus didactylus]|uniref:uncharacterized protein LOC119528525 isoform X2 n=1 Tax=Choloepus didactylus TaxID=27675 RepID=UPI00189F0347|nr:uncharacterized protein LOC119528525 isoform X2 [Choloepus didactylus]